MLLLLWAWPAGALGPAAAAVALPKPIPLTMPQITLLSQHKYEVHADGSVFNESTGKTVSPDDMPSILARLESTQRLLVLLRLRLILTSSDGDRYLSPAEREQIRSLVRENWPYFTMRMRRGFRSYFSLEELEQMDRVPPAEEGDITLEMKDPVIDASQVEASGGSPFAPPTAAAAAAAAPPAAPAVAQAASPSSVIFHPAVRVGSAIPVPAAPAPTVILHPAAAAGAVRPPLPIPPAPSRPAFSEQPTIAGPRKAAPKLAAPKPAAPVAPAGPPAMPNFAVVPLPPAPKAVSPDDFLRFLAGGAYTTDVRGLLKIVSDYAPAYARDRALSAVLEVMPLIMIDSARTGFQARGDLLVQRSPGGDTAYAITLSPGPAIYTKEHFFIKTTALLPDSPRSYAALHLPMPAVQALEPNAAAVQEERNGWGQTRIFSDGSRRGLYSDASMAGTLLRNLLRLDAHRFGWDASPYAAELYARQAQMMLYADVAAKTGNDDFLDPDMKAAYREWLGYPAEFRDFLVHTIASGRIQLLDPRKGDPTAQAGFDAAQLAACPASLGEDNTQRLALNRKALEATAKVLEGLGLASAKDAAAASAAIDKDLSGAAKTMGSPAMDACARRWETEASGLKQAAALLSDMETAEAQFRRQHPPQGADHAP